MLVRWLLASVHLLALPIGLGAVVVRAGALRGPLDRPGIDRALRADLLWAVAAALWVTTGLVRAFGGFEKGAAYYTSSTAFWIKMALLVGIFFLEIAPIVGLTRWRRSIRRGEAPDTGRAALYARISVVQAVMAVLMVLLATAMARGVLV